MLPFSETNEKERDRVEAHAMTLSLFLKRVKVVEVFFSASNLEKPYTTVKGWAKPVGPLHPLMTSLQLIVPCTAMLMTPLHSAGDTHYRNWTILG